MDRSPSWFGSFSALTSLSRGICDNRDQRDGLLLARNPYPSDEDLDPLGDMKICGIYKPASILPGQNKDIVVEDIERKTLSKGALETGLEEVVSPLVEIPSMIKLDASQLGKVVRIFFGAERVVGNGCRDDNGANRAGDESAVPAGE